MNETFLYFSETISVTDFKDVTLDIVFWFYSVLIISLFGQVICKQDNILPHNSEVILVK